MDGMHEYGRVVRVRRFNWRLMARVTGVLSLYLAAGLLVPFGVSLCVRDGMQFALAAAGLLILMAGLLLRNMVGGRAEYSLREDESYWLTVAVWVCVPLFGALPYLFTGVTASFTDALFESFSGFTTTGSSVIGRPEDLPQSIKVYRATTQWVGGLGLLLLVVAVLRRLGLGAGSLYEAEFSGTQQRRLHPRLARSVTRMWVVYGLVTTVMWVVLAVQGVGVIDAFCVACSTVSTGGFVTHSGGVAAMGQGVVTTVTAFMFLSGVNVAVLYRLLTLRWRGLWRDAELRVYAVVYVFAAAVCTVAFVSKGGMWGESVRYALFHVASTMSTCGFYMSAPQGWPFFVSVVTFVLMVVGASAGSTGGGLKVRRVMVVARYLANYFNAMIHPNAVTRVKMNGEVVEEGYVDKVLAFVFLYVLFIVGGAWVLTMCGSSIPEALSMAAANVGNLGPSPVVDTMGGHLDYALLRPAAKWTLAVLMVAGRVELFALVAVVSPSYWRLRRLG